jgi:hypothetical protein
MLPSLAPTAHALVRSRALVGWLASLAFLVYLPCGEQVQGEDRPVRRPEPAPMPDATSKPAWTLDEALAQLRLYPRDAYLQYVALQLAKREGKLDKTIEEIEELVGREDQQQTDRRDSVDLFSVFTGALAVQESLQLDTMRDEQPSAWSRRLELASSAPAPPGTETVVRKVPVTVCVMEQVAETDSTGRTYTVTKPTYKTIYKEVVETRPAAQGPRQETITRMVPYTVTKKVPVSETGPDGQTRTVYKTVCETCYREVVETQPVPAAAQPPDKPEPIGPPKEAAGEQDADHTCEGREELPPPRVVPEATPASPPAAPSDTKDKSSTEDKPACEDRASEIVQVDT